MTNTDNPDYAIVFGQGGWRLQNDNLNLFITEQGGQMAPVTFYCNTVAPVQPYFISPWQNEKLSIDVPILQPLRGDFFCMPFGGNSTPVDGEKHPPHGEPAGSRWQFQSIERLDGKVTMTLEMNTSVRVGHICKEITLQDGHNAVYLCHRLSGYHGRMPLGHHPILKTPEHPGGMLLSLGHFALGMTHPAVFSDPVNQEYQQLAYGREFSDLTQMPLLWTDEPYGDYSIYPSRLGFTDLFAVAKIPDGNPAWATAVYPEQGYLWFALKDPAILPTTAVWTANSGRYQSPWNGRVSCIAIEDVCSYFTGGRSASLADNPLSRCGFPTSIELDPTQPTEIRHIQGVVKIPAGYGRVTDVTFAPGMVTFSDANGCSVSTTVAHEFLQDHK